jgi:hypothetical protein
MGELIDTPNRSCSVVALVGSGILCSRPILSVVKAVRLSFHCTWKQTLKFIIIKSVLYQKGCLLYSVILMVLLLEWQRLGVLDMIRVGAVARGKLGHFDW